MRNLIFIFIILASCTNKKSNIYFQEVNGTKFQNSVSLEEGGLVPIYLDKETGFFHFSMKYSHINNKSYLSFINTHNQNFYLYNLKTGKLKNKIKFQNEGINGIGHLSICDHIYLNNDSLLIYNSWEGTLSILDSLGNLIFKDRLLDYSKDNNFVIPDPSTMNPIKKAGDFVFIPCTIENYLSDYSNQSSLLRYNLITKEVNLMISLPSNYNQGYWGESFKYKTSFDIQGSNIISSFPIDNFIYQHDTSGNFSNKYYVGSKFITEFEPMNDDVNYGIKKDHSVYDEAQKDYSFSNSDYSSIIYDDFRDLFYRIAYIRPKKSEVIAGRKMPDFSIIILNSNFKKVGEHLFDGLKYHPAMIFVSKYGLLVGRSDLYRENENVLNFSIIKVKK